ncbi:DUF3160 domain-containing protein [Aminipila butyrica]|uniref:DUF3160 domain-containing protein n=1 Tax=Aminipila butyrica TaxID=433296 RepID=A0A858BU98_9FIRM|nr:DUF3160 domain-containing protein [Aminipila butyrica]QIB68912.1 DUF3160 domain-containing protein [Aminipila butyrica]
MNKKKRTKASIMLAILLLLTSFSSCQNKETTTDLPVISDNGFAEYQEVAVDIKPAVKDYQVAQGLSNVTNREHFSFSDEAQKLLIKNGFVVVPYPVREFFTTYELNRYDNTPNFITTDAMLHNYHLYFNYLLRTLEKDSLRGELNSLTQSMLTKSQSQYQALKETEWENAAKRNVAFFAVAAKLLDPKSDIPALVNEEVKQELQLIVDHQENFYPSPVMNMGDADDVLTETFNEDYTQYIPRGHYAKSYELKTYFQAMMWYGRMNFRVSNEDETKSAVLMARLFDQDDYGHWNNIYEPTNFFVGQSDDLGINQYTSLLQKVYGKNPSLKEVTEEASNWKALFAQIQNLDPPAINSMPIFNKDIQPDREKTIKGFRFMGQRFTLDASIFQNLVYRQVEENAAGELRMLPKALDIPAAMGSQEAYDILKDMGETSYKNYPENMKNIQQKMKAMEVTDRTQNLYGAWLYMLTPLTEEKGKGYPSFMQNQAWNRKQLETYISSFTELKHDTVLYAKQIYAEMGGGGEELDDRGYVEPNPVVYGRLAALTKMTADGLQSRELLDEQTREGLNELEELALQLKTISEKELAQKPLSSAEYDLIRSFGGQLEHFWLEAFKDQGVDSPSAVGENPAALITDIATDPNGWVLEEGTGFVNDIYVVVPVEGSLRIAKGAVYSYYEFAWPSNDRLTDAKWKEMLETEENPAAPDWTKSYTAPMITSP